MDNNHTDKIMKFAHFFKEPESASLIPRHASLRQPLNFEKRLNTVSNKIFEINSQQTLYGLKETHYMAKAKDEKLFGQDPMDK